MSRPLHIHRSIHYHHRDDSLAQNLIVSVVNPINVFRNQIIFNVDTKPGYQFKKPPPYIDEPNYDRDNLFNALERYLNPIVTNCIKTSERINNEREN